MADRQADSSMEEILSSIKRIIAEDKAVPGDDGDARPVEPKSFAKLEMPPRKEPEEDILELTEAVEAGPADSGNERLINDDKLAAMRASLSALAAMEKVEKRPVLPVQGQTSLEDMVREMLRPMLAQWLDDNLPALVEEMVAREIQRISGK